MKHAIQKITINLEIIKVDPQPDRIKDVVKEAIQISKFSIGEPTFERLLLQMINNKQGE